MRKSCQSLAHNRIKSESTLNMDYLFDFDAWLISNDLKHLKQIFIDHNLCTPQTINFHSKYFSKLITDPRIQSKPAVTQKIISAVRALTKRNGSQQSMVLVSQAENNALLQIQFYIKNMQELEQQFKNLMVKYGQKCDRDQQQINNYIHFLKQDLNAKNQEIEDIFDDLLNSLTLKRQQMMDKIENDFPEKFNKYQIKHNDITNYMNDKIVQIENTMQDESNHIKQRENQCKQLIRDFNEHLSVRSSVYKAQRENKIIQIVNQTSKCHSEAMHFLRANIQDIREFLRMKIAFDIDINDNDTNQNIFEISKRDKLLKSIKRNLAKCVDIQYSASNLLLDTDYDTESDCSTDSVQKKKEKRKKNKTKHLKKEINTLNDKLQTANKSFDELRESKESEINSLKHEIQQLQQQLEMQAKGKLELEEAMKGMTMKVETFEARMENDDSSGMKYIDKWDGFYVDNNKWRLLDNGKKLKGIWRKESKYFCAFLDCDSSKTNGGIYSCSIKWERPNDADDKVMIPGHLKAPCSIGISTLRDVKVIKNGVKWSDRWPDWAGDKSISSHFDSTSEAPSWYINEVITIKLDLDNSMVYYFKDNKLIKKENIHDKLPCYVMLCACPNITGQFCYSIVNPIH